MKNRLLLLFLFSGFCLSAQEQIKLDDLNDFKEQAGNWSIVGGVLIDRTIDVHDILEIKPEKKSKKRKRKKKNTIIIPKAIAPIPGTGVLLNINNSVKNDAIETVWEHGDIKLELEVILPKGSNSGIYLQGRYELQLKDSWGVENPKISDMGGIHNNWETTADKIFKGVSPSSNASKAPGLWQKIRIHFQAPKFNSAGEKITNAKFVSVFLNDVQIHSNVELPHYTGGPISKQEVAKGPLVIQGNHGPVAFKNISYQLLEDSKISISNLAYKTYKGQFKGLKDLNKQKIVSEGTSKQIDIHLTKEEDAYGIIFSGTLNIPKEDTYTFTVGYTGGVDLQIDGESLILYNSAEDERKRNQSIKLSSGSHLFTLKNIKTAPWRAPKLGLFIESNSTNSKKFHAYSSYPPSLGYVSPIFVTVGAKPNLLRGFVQFKGNKTKLSHTIGVGIPGGINFVYDLNSANIIGVWRGNFIDATPMWHNRGDGSFTPRGALQWTFLNQPTAELLTTNNAFPETGEKPEFISKGYSLGKNGLPTFKHIYKGVTIENTISPDKSNRFLGHEIRFSKTGLINWYHKLASGKIEKTSDGAYAINDRDYYIKVTSGQIPTIREINGTKELILAVDGSTITYEIIW
ncbi:MAG: family 16 glycoside hydrolase [Cellulophaga sp.]